MWPQQVLTPHLPYAGGRRSSPRTDKRSLRGLFCAGLKNSYLRYTVLSVQTQDSSKTAQGKSGNR